MAWIPFGAWLGALAVALIVLGYCAYEITWKSARLRRDVHGLVGLTGEVAALQQQLADAQQRIAAAGLR